MTDLNRRRLLGGIAAGAALSALPAAASAGPKWVGAWASSQMVPNPDTTLPPDMASDVTIRQIVRLTQGGRQFRVRLSNVFGTRPLKIGAAHAAISADQMTSRIDPAQARGLTFGGRTAITIPAGAEYVSDPVVMAVTAFTDLTLSLYLPEAASPQTSHPGARIVSYFARGNRVAEAALDGAKTMERWFHISGVDVEASAKSAAIVTLGDSITDGYGVKPGMNARWTDQLARRLQAEARTRHLSVLNHGIGGGRILNDGSGPNAMARFERDVLAQTGVKYLVILEGVNDLGTLTKDAPVSAAAHAQLVEDMIGAYRQMIRRARERGIKVIGATILPFMGFSLYHPDAQNEADRQAVNRWIRTSGAFDAVIDFDRLMADPADPTRLRPDYDSGDHIHPSMAGYKVMGDAVDLRFFQK
ncbi:SGNH/GDSL hydrolase family protein [Asticcacaulis sp. AND118]|uniref:SGNH/GDSL hydrolase family protein n=1 Tax=Asticcacaulis sp. AND118 TaxID=2840468 RepID=UPI001CFF66E5|nr:SGNH/GDSL hydrolase family protein [Asticcacaulis sp. AND118]UDF04970.1 SGNH/GDSL hydrolase family protein [Asticcacaulis sp. AND118]